MWPHPGRPPGDVPDLCPVSRRRLAAHPDVPSLVSGRLHLKRPMGTFRQLITCGLLLRSGPYLRSYIAIISSWKIRPHFPHRGSSSIKISNEPAAAPIWLKNVVDCISYLGVCLRTLFHLGWSSPIL